MNLIKDFDTVIVDLDFTIWHGSQPQIWAKSLVSPCSLTEDRITDTNGDYLRLDSEVRDIFPKIQNLGFITRGGLLNVPFDFQPPVQCLKVFGIFSYFTYCRHVLYCTDNKGSVLLPQGRTLYIDDLERDLRSVQELHPDVTCINRNLFKSWKELLA